MKEKIYSCFDWSKVQRPVDCGGGTTGCISCWRAKKMELPVLIRALEVFNVDPGVEKSILLEYSDLIHYWGNHIPRIKQTPNEIDRLLKEFYSKYVFSKTSWEDGVRKALDLTTDEFKWSSPVSYFGIIRLWSPNYQKSVWILLKNEIILVIGNNREVLVFTVWNGIAVFPLHESNETTMEEEKITSEKISNKYKRLVYEGLKKWSSLISAFGRNKSKPIKKD